jgi:hypothetical protein
VRGRAWPLRKCDVGYGTFLTFEDVRYSVAIGGQSGHVPDGLEMTRMTHFGHWQANIAAPHNGSISRL